MRVDVYETEGEALEAAAARAEAALAETPAPHPAVAIPGGRAGRALMLALASRVELPWERTRFCVVDEPIAAASNRLLLHKQLLVPRRIAGPPPTDGDRAGAWEAEVRAAAGPDLVFDVVLLDLGPQGEIGALDAASLAAAAGATVARTAERVGLGPVV
ncbi:MAG TPA: 6-phosphogluconolactonase, partial [Candidatus Limnocylindria bacterium]|nr:6-phosphogluconolactonase [Candidatus Limnocylindria bacterium]